MLLICSTGNTNCSSNFAGDHQSVRKLQNQGEVGRCCHPPSFKGRCEVYSSAIDVSHWASHSLPSITSPPQIKWGRRPWSLRSWDPGQIWPSRFDFQSHNTLCSRGTGMALGTQKHSRVLIGRDYCSCSVPYIYTPTFVLLASKLVSVKTLKRLADLKPHLQKELCGPAYKSDTCLFYFSA